MYFVPECTCLDDAEGVLIFHLPLFRCLKKKKSQNFSSWRSVGESGTVHGSLHSTFNLRKGKGKHVAMEMWLICFLKRNIWNDFSKITNIPFKKNARPSQKSAFASMMLVVQLLSGSAIFVHHFCKKLMLVPGSHSSQVCVGRQRGMCGSRGKIHLCHSSRTMLLYCCRAIGKAAEGRVSGQGLSDQMKMTPAELLQSAFVILIGK